MPATVSTSFIGNPEVRDRIHSAIEDFFKGYSGDWRVSVVGAAHNDIWVLKVTAPDNKSWQDNLHGHDGAHPVAIIEVLKRIAVGYPSKKYLRLGEPVAGAVIGPWVGYIRGSAQWVSKVEEASADYRVAAEVTQERLKNEYGLATMLEEVPDPLLMQPKWVICKDN